MTRRFLVVMVLMTGVGAGVLAPRLISALSAPSPELWLVTSHHPHDLEDLKPVSKVYRESGRIRLVTLTVPFETLPDGLKGSLRRISESEIIQYRPEIPTDSVRADARIEAVLSELSMGNYREKVSYLASHENRDVAGLDRKGGSGNERSVEWLAAEFAAMGYTVEKDCYKERKFAGECNVLATREGTELPDEMVYVVGHLDDVGKHQAGADDNATGAAALLELARVVASYPTRRTIVFFATNGEEVGLVGSTAHVRLLAQQGQIAKVKFAINMDMIGYNENGVVDIETNRPFESVAKWYSEQVAAYTKLRPNISIPAWGSDHVPFLDENVPTILTIEHWDTKTPCYHQSCDKLGTVNWEYAGQILRLNLAVILQKAEWLGPSRG